MANNPNSPPDDGKIKLPRTDAAMNKIAPAPSREPKGKSKKTKVEEDAALLAKARKRFDRCVQHEGDNRKSALRALNFVQGKQWDDGDLKAREGRPSLTINKLKTFVNQVANGQRENRPSINISPEGDRGDRQVAQMLKGVIRKIERDCNADIAYDTAFWNAVASGWGWWRVKTDYETHDTFDQVIEIDAIPNSFSVYTDPESREPDNADSRFNFVTEMMDREDFKAEYPDADPINFEGVNTGETYKAWVNEKQVRIAEYWVIEKKKQRLLALSNGWVGTEDELAEDVRASIDSGKLKIENERESEHPKVMQYKITAKEILERKEWPGKWIPLVRVIGNCINIEGKPSYTGVVGDALDPQRMYNYWASLQTELLAMQPKAPFVVAEGQIENYEDQWAQANTRPIPYLTYNPVSLDGHPLPPPQRQGFSAPPTGIVDARNATSQDMQAVTGIRFDATMHERMNDESGRALREIRRATDIGTYHFVDNLSRSLKHTGRILVDLIPKIYDTKRVLTIIREDDKEEPVMLDPNQAQAVTDKPHPMKAGQKLTSINPTSGKYGVTVTIGPDSATKRIEAVETLMQFVHAVPQAGQLAMDIIAKNMDGPGMDVLAARLAKAIPPHFMDLPQLKGLPPEVQGLIGSQQNEIQQHKAQLMQFAKMLQDKTADRAQAQDKIDKDFEAKLLAVVQKAQAAQDKSLGDKVQGLTDQVTQVMDALATHSQALMQMQQVQPQQGNVNV